MVLMRMIHVSSAAALGDDELKEEDLALPIHWGMRKVKIDLLRPRHREISCAVRQTVLKQVRTAREEPFAQIIFMSIINQILVSYDKSKLYLLCFPQKKHEQPNQ